MTSPPLQLLLALVVCAAALIGYGAWYAAIVQMSNIAAQLESQIETKIEARSRIASARTALAAIAGDEASVQGYFVQGTGVVAFIDDLEARGREQGATVSVLSVATGSAGEHSVLTLAVSLKGTFNAVMRTLGSIEYMPRDLTISTLSLAQDDKNSWRADLKLVVGSVAAKNTQ